MQEQQTKGALQRLSHYLDPCFQPLILWGLCHACSSLVFCFSLLIQVIIKFSMWVQQKLCSYLWESSLTN